jgi:hypothetical protein
LLPRHVDNPQMAGQLIDMPNLMVTMFWNPFGIHVLAALPEKTSYDAGHFVDYLLAPIAELPVMHMTASQNQKTCYSYGQFADTQVESSHSKNCFNAIQTRYSSIVLTGSASIRLLSF